MKMSASLCPLFFVLVPPLAEVDGEEGDSVDGQPVVPAGAGAGGIPCLVPLPCVGVWLICIGGDGDDVLPPPVACHPVPLLLPSLTSQPVPLGSIVI